MFVWGEIDGADFRQVIDAAYAEVVHWRRNVFQVPSGAAGKEFVAKLTRLFYAYAEQTALESVALTAVMVLPVLLLQKPHAHSKTKEHAACLERRMVLWKKGDINGLVREGRVIQKHLKCNGSFARQDNSNLRGFTRLMLLGNTRGALRVLSNCNGSGVLGLSDTLTDADGRDKTVHDVLLDKHPKPGPVRQEALLSSACDQATTSAYHVLFDRLTGDLIRSCALRTEGSSGPSAVDASGWRRLCTAFHAASTSLCDSVAATARRLCTSYVDPSCLRAFTACRLIPLDKNPGVRPIGVCETVRRIIGKAIMSIVSQDVRLAAGPLQVCAGQPAGA